MDKKISSKEFFIAWRKVVELNKDDLCKRWQRARLFTELIFSGEHSILRQVAKEINLEVYPKDYYSIDALFYKKDDLVPSIIADDTFLRDVRVAFEHENFFKSGLYKEVSHLLITNCDLRVLVSYPNCDKDESYELEVLREVIEGNRMSEQISDDESFLLIFGGETDFQWKGLIYKTDGWVEIIG